MKGKNPTREQCKIIKRNGLNYEEWLVQKDMRDTMQIVHRDSKEVRIINKEM